MMTRLMALIATAFLFVCSTLPRPAAVMAVKDRDLWDTDRFLQFHPDVSYRKKALWALEQGDVSAAVDDLRQAARYGDKPAQALLAELYWGGEHLPRDPALGYAWMDLAAERGYALFLAKRESYWRGLDSTQRQLALEQGRQLYAEYGDQVAKPRMQALLRQARYAITGSRLGFVGSLTVQVPINGIWKSFGGSQYYADRYWRADDYFEWTDSIWQPWPVGTVDVGGPSPVSEASVKP